MYSVRLCECHGSNIAAKWHTGTRDSKLAQRDKSEGAESGRSEWH
jgi:hypothetical protein